MRNRTQTSRRLFSGQCVFWLERLSDRHFDHVLKAGSDRDSPYQGGEVSPAIGGKRAAGNRRGDSTQIAALTQMRHARARKSHREIRLGAADCQKRMAAPSRQGHRRAALAHWTATDGPDTDSLHRSFDAPLGPLIALGSDRAFLGPPAPVYLLLGGLGFASSPSASRKRQEPGDRARADPSSARVGAEAWPLLPWCGRVGWCVMARKARSVGREPLS